jgi:hypothetical protein
MWVPLVGLWTQ